MIDSASKSSERELPIRDHDAALATAGGNADLMQELFATFLAGIGPHWEELRLLCQAEDWDALCESSHRLHGSAAYCGVPALRSAVKALEAAAAAGNQETIASAMDALARQIDRLHQFVRDSHAESP